MLRLITAGESHGKGIISILEGIPAGLSIKIKDIDLELIRRQSGYGRGARMKIEKDGAEILSGIRQGRTLGSPITIFIKNRDWENNKNLMSEFPADKINASLQKPRPGHADLAGYMKYGVSDFRDILERASARETAGRAAAGAICKIFLKVFGINVYSFVSQIGDICADFEKLPLNKILIKAAKSPLSCPDEEASKKMIALIEETAQKGDTLGGKFIVKITGVPAGLGSHTQWDLKLDGRLAQSLMSIQAVKSVEFGLGSNLAGVLGSNASDEIFYKKEKGFYRKTNRAGGIEGGMSNGEVIEITCSMKPIPTLAKPLNSVNLISKKAEKAESVRSDICAVSAAAVVAESAAAFEIARALKEKFGGDSLKDIEKNINLYKTRLKNL